MDITKKYKKFRSKIESLLINSNSTDLISEINDFEKNLVEIENLYNETNKIAKIGGWKINLKTSEIKWTKEVYQIHEISEDFNPTLEKVIEFYDEHSRKIIQQAIDEAIKYEKPFEEELAIITAKGNKIYVRTIGKIKNDENGTSEILYGTFQDISDKKKAEKEILNAKEKAETSEQQLKLIANNLVDGMIYQVAMLDENKRQFNYLSNGVFQLYGCKAEEAMKDPNLIYGKIHPDDIDTLVAAEKEALKSMSIFKVEARVINPDGSIRWSYYVSQPRIINNLACWDGIEMDITKRKLIEIELKVAKEKAEGNENEIKNQKEAIKLHNDRLESLLRISQFQTNSTQELLDYALEEAIELTNSKIGYIYFYNESTRQFILNTWSKEVMKECAVQNPQTIYNLDDTGCWGEAVRQRKPIVMNEYNNEDPIKKGTPEGHVNLNKFLTIPVIFDNKIVAVAGVANKKTDYDNADIRQLTLLMDNVWKISERLSFIDKLNISIEKARENEEKYKNAYLEANQFAEILNNLPSYVYIMDLEHKYKYANKVTLDLFKKTSENVVGTTDFDFFPHETAEQIWELDKQILEEGKTTKEEALLKMYENNSVWFHEVKFPIFDETGKISGLCGISTDITSLKEIEQALHESEVLKRAILNGISANIIFVDLDLKIIWANQAAAKSVDKKPEDMIGLPCYKFWANSKEVCDNCPSARAIKTRKKEHQIINSSDGRVWDESGEPVFDESGNLIGIVEIAQDITDKVKAEDALKASEERFRKALEFLPVPIAVSNSKGEFVFHNKQFINTYGYTIEDIPTQSAWFDVVYPDPEYRNYVINDWTNAVKQAKHNKFTTSVREYNITCKDGAVKLVAVSAYIESDYSFGLFVDITEQRRLEQALRESEENLRAIGDNIPKGQIYQMLVEKDGKSRFTYISKKVEQLHEWKAEEVIANPQLLFGRIVPHDVDEFRRATEKSIKEMSVFDHTLRIKRKSGEIRWHRMISSPRKLLDGNILFNGIEIDITKQKLAEINLNKYSDELKKLNADKDRFIQILAHDLRNPFNSLLGFSDILISNINEYDKLQIEELLKIIHQTSHNTFNLLEDLLLWSKSQSGILSFQPHTYIFMDICQEIIELMRIIANEKNITIRCLGQEKLEIFVDKSMFKTILRNLISNAIKYSNSNGQINIYAERDKENVIITVSDNGVGIDKENISKLFEFKSQFTTKGTAGESGTGFGLTLCKEFIEKHGGKIRVESEAGKGSDFKFSIPINKV